MRESRGRRGRPAARSVAGGGAPARPRCAPTGVPRSSARTRPRAAPAAPPGPPSGEATARPSFCCQDTLFSSCSPGPPALPARAARLRNGTATARARILGQEPRQHRISAHQHAASPHQRASERRVTASARRLVTSMFRIALRRVASPPSTGARPLLCMRRATTTTEEPDEQDESSKVMNLTVADVMDKSVPLTSVTSTTSVTDAALKLSESPFNTLLVTDAASGRITGAVRAMQLLTHLVKGSPPSVQARHDGACALRPGFLHQPAAHSAMQVASLATPALVLKSSTPLLAAVRKLLAAEQSVLPITADDGDTVVAVRRRRTQPAAALLCFTNRCRSLATAGGLAAPPRGRSRAGHGRGAPEAGLLEQRARLRHVLPDRRQARAAAAAAALGQPQPRGQPQPTPCPAASRPGWDRSG